MFWFRNIERPPSLDAPLPPAEARRLKATQREMTAAVVDHYKKCCRAAHFDCEGCSHARSVLVTFAAMAALLLFLGHQGVPEVGPFIAMSALPWTFRLHCLGRDKVSLLVVAFILAALALTLASWRELAASYSQDAMDANQLAGIASLMVAVAVMGALIYAATPQRDSDPGKRSPREAMSTCLANLRPLHKCTAVARQFPSMFRPKSLLDDRVAMTLAECRRDELDRRLKVRTERFLHEMRSNVEAGSTSVSSEEVTAMGDDLRRWCGLPPVP